MSLRTALLVLAFVPGIALVALWGVTSGQTLFDFQRQAGQGLLAEKAGQLSNETTPEEDELLKTGLPGAAHVLAQPY
ncbi:hypothetical protein ACTMTU_01105 [Streptomyces sp. OZ13]|uniref:hypothetical protein n=1 Tax=Streptomyces sp. OZ13 TaxID=3452210 RepID=UPI003F8BA82A